MYNFGTGSSDGICETITITSYSCDGYELDNKYFFVNAWLQNVEEVSIDYSQSEAIRYTATFQYDFFTYGTELPAFGQDAQEVVGGNDGIDEQKADA